MIARWLLVARTLALASIVGVAGCATAFGKDYGACVKTDATLAFKQDTAPNIIAQVSSIVSLAVSAQWVQGMLTLLQDACEDTACTELFYCAIRAWDQSHPSTSAASAKVQSAHLGVAAVLARKPVSLRFDNCPHLAATSGTITITPEDFAKQTSISNITLAIPDYRFVTNDAVFRFLPDVCGDDPALEAGTCREIQTDDDVPETVR